MVINRFFFDGSISETLTLEGEEHHHLVHVVRAGVGEEIELVDGKGTLATAKVTGLSKRGAQLEVLSQTHEPPPVAPFTLVQGLCRQNRLDLILEKGTELGVDRFIFISMDRSEKRPLNLDRLQRVTQGALKQSGRLYLPAIEELPSLAALKCPSPYFGDFNAPLSLPKVSKEPHTFVVGPESGFSEKELNWLRERGQGVKLNHNILRCETAAIAAATLFGLLRG